MTCSLALFNQYEILLKMKHSLLVVTFILFACSISAQKSSYDQRLLSKFTQVELEEMPAKNSIAYAYWNFYVANAYQIIDLPAEKEDSHEIKGRLQIKDLNNINIFDLQHLPLVKDFQYYTIEGSKKLLVIISEELIKEKFVKSTEKK